MSNEIKVVMYGLGYMGRGIAKLLLEKKGVKIVGAIDISKDIVGRDLGEVLKIERNLGVTVSNNSEVLLSKVEADIVIHATTSHLSQAYPQIAECVEEGFNVISTCEELSYPFEKNPELASKLDRLAKENNVTVLGTGINPGFLMDTLPIVLTGVCQDVKKVKVTRMMYSGNRRIPFQKKIGTGLSPREFKQKIEGKEITGHVGLSESIMQIAAALGWKLEEVVELPPEPVIAERELKTDYITVKPGQVAGLKSIGKGVMNGKEVITLEFISHAGVEEPYDEVLIEGIPNIHERIIGGVHGDIGTIAMVVNMIPKVINARPGLLTMKDIALPSAVTEDMRIYLEWEFL